MSEKLKVVWICHFVNQEMKDHFNTPQINEFAPWISILINLFQNKKNIELYIIAPNVFTNQDCRFKKNGINYFFYKHIPIPFNNKCLRKAHSLFRVEILTNFFWIKRKIFIETSKIDPDIIHLHGAENPYYSAGIIPLINKYPILLTIQGFIRNASGDLNYVVKNKIAIEEIILKKVKNFGVRTEEMKNITLQLNPDAILYDHNYPVTIPNEVKDNIGKDEPIDCLFFARLSKDKGIEDLISAIAIVKVKYPKIALSVIGGASRNYFTFLKKLCTDLSIEENVCFLGFLDTQDDIYKYALKAKMCVLPTYHDIIPGTIIESMFMKLPVVAYAVGGIPELNKKKNSIKLVEKQNIKQLAQNIIELLDSVDSRKTLTENAYHAANERFSNNGVLDILEAYNMILKRKIMPSFAKCED